MISLGGETVLSFQYGGIEVRHVYANPIGPQMTEDEWRKEVAAHGWYLPPPTRGFPGFSFHNELVMAYQLPTGMFAPVKYWLWHFPLWLPTVLAALPAAWLGRKWFRQRGVERRGFEVVVREGGVRSEQQSGG
jgi:hypothetical protein